MHRVINGDGTTMYCVTYESFFASILLYGLRHAKCEQLLGKCTTVELVEEIFFNGSSTGVHQIADADLSLRSRRK